jgi:hypothetical protein
MRSEEAIEPTTIPLARKSAATTCRHSVSNPQLTVFLLKDFFRTTVVVVRIAEYNIKTTFFIRNSPNVHLGRSGLLR